MRGSLGHWPQGQLRQGIIPAHAGLTLVTLYISSSHRDHPRACGAHSGTTTNMPGNPGSSPRMRGSQVLILLPVLSVGIIPAHAGLTRWSSQTCRLERDHPRACGAHMNGTVSCRMTRGSSPRMRGSHVLEISQEGRRGIIPAHAGLTGGRLHGQIARRDHPRACGAHAGARIVTNQDGGSSPRMRGSRFKCIEVNRIPRIIPAHAGLTFP